MEVQMLVQFIGGPWHMRIETMEAPPAYHRILSCPSRACWVHADRAVPGPPSLGSVLYRRRVKRLDTRHRPTWVIYEVIR